ncbi:DUF4382 domain-containing protein [Chryseobacterium koreense]|uniref:DUF4382 domain-containing protein n=1 Tax=Chryseobacterium koreense CCUG 49689 TaxID=1304281 RepID=A0A0J7IWF2_9FLAO|nr:DUF4382 domain-containing protein [Chryseobacterium koreense]KMQ70126.1 hypothetical protein ACM44_14005 [Chryseobacterium koreense CCUG 49689]MBB5332332.1 hypothetical protein [Chryseobacterium koreense]
MKKSMILAGIISAFTMWSCSTDTATGNDTAMVNVKLTDAPALYDAVNIDIQKVEFTTNNGTTTFNAVNPGVYNLLNFRNGMDVLLSQAILPVGNVSQMRLILGNNNSVVVNGVTYPLDTPSAQQSGLKLNWNQTLSPNGAYNVWIDFDAGRSIVKTGNGSYKLKPVLRAFSEATDGQIKGYVQPQAANAMVHVIKAADTIATALPNADGFFMFRGLPANTYNVSFDAAANTGYIDQNKADVNVVFGQITDLGITTLHQ